MSLAIIDAREWQRMFDLRTCDRVEQDGPMVRMTKRILHRHPFPGDLEEGGLRWVTDVALELVREYDPAFMFLTYAQPYFKGRYAAMGPKQRAVMVSAVKEEVERFVAASGFLPVIVGTGDMTERRDGIDLTGLDGLAVATHWSARYAGLHAPSRKDLRTVAAQPGLDRIVPRREWLDLFGGTEAQGRRVPDYLLVAKEGRTFRTLGQAHREVVRIPAASSARIPVSLHGGPAKEITDIRGMVEEGLRHRKTALVMVEGIGAAEFPWPCSTVQNGRDWFYYEPGDGQYLTIASGAHRVFDYPTGYRYFDEIMEDKAYPLSGYFTAIPEGTLGSAFPGKSAAVGDRSMFMHMVPGADLSVEVFARNLYNQGTMAVLHRQDKY
ncbi:MAG TPA: hypothetical protein VN436_06195 [Holophaga sp.]|nr:hypothetical protein [Holophaga sp.]